MNRRGRRPTEITCHDCSATTATKPRTAEFFYRLHRSPDGLQYACKSCQRQRCKAKYDRKYTASIRVSATQKQREYWVRSRKRTTP